MRIIFLSLFALSVSFLSAQKKQKKDHEAILAMSGCYQVEFNFAETFEYSEDQNYQPSKVKHDKGLEWVEVVENEKDKVVLQHILIVGQPNDPQIVKHWRQDWLYQNTDLYEYDADNRWKFVQLPKRQVKEQWTQKVYQVDDSPRYEGTASWVHVDNKSYWENTTTAPLPRREHTKRSDYNVTLRRNRHEITNFGWIHDQDNDKIVKKDGKQTLLAQEKGFNTYTKVSDSRCKAAQDYWAKNHKMWKVVRDEFQNIFAKKQNLHLHKAVDNKPLFVHLFGMNEKSEPKEIKKTIQSFVAK